MATVSEIDESVLNYNSKTVNDYMQDINNELADIDKTMNKELYQSKRPDSIVSRVFTDLFGVIGLYLMLFILSDFTRVVLTGDSFFGIKWIFWGPYYFFTEAPLLTRVWESKKFLKDLSEIRTGEGFEWQENRSCTDIGNTYLDNCNSQTIHNHPVRDKLGDGLDWLIRHTVGKHFGGILGNGDCTDQSTTIAQDCAYDRVMELWGAYIGFCDMYPTLITHRATDLNWPNTVSMSSGYLSQFSEYDKVAYQTYYNGYLKIYDIGSTVFTGHGTPDNLNPAYDSETYYCYDAETIFMAGHGWFPVPQWYIEGVMALSDEKSRKMYFQRNYKDHMLDV